MASIFLCVHFIVHCKLYVIAANKLINKYQSLTIHGGGVSKGIYLYIIYIPSSSIISHLSRVLRRFSSTTAQQNY